jgi:hypothetical protein
VWTAEGGTGSARTFELFMDRLVAWNLEDEQGLPVPVTREAVEAEDDDMVQAVIKRWTDAVLGVPAPLESGSTSGETVGGGIDAGGNPVTKPGELTYAERFSACVTGGIRRRRKSKHCPQSVWRLLEIERLGVNPDVEPGGDHGHG